MPDREKVVNGLEYCLLRSKEKVHCGDCPYWQDDFESGCHIYDMIRDALTLLKEQEARVMTLEEVCNLKYDDVVYYQGINTNSVESAIVLRGEKMVPEVNTRVVQFRHADGTGGWNGINNADLNGYGKKWRCWTSRPSPEQMRDTPWEEDSDAE